MLQASRSTTAGAILLVLVVGSNSVVEGFTPAPRHSAQPLQTQLFSAPTLSVREIKEELKDRGVSFADCFDKESLLKRLEEAREKPPAKQTEAAAPKAEATIPKATTDSSNSAESKKSTETTKTAAPAQSATPKQAAADFDEDAAELRGMRVKELRTELASRNLRWAHLLEKEDLVQALLDARRVASHFSATGLVAPGQVATLTGAQAAEEVEFAGDAPLLLDVFATWCGPCQMMAPQLEQAAQAWGDRVRVAKMDSDQNPQQASQWRVQGLPSLILFQNGKEIDRIEGALMKDQLIQWVESKVSSTSS